jgi:hypothetical protein
MGKLKTESMETIAISLLALKARPTRLTPATTISACSPSAKFERCLVGHEATPLHTNYLHHRKPSLVDDRAFKENVNIAALVHTPNAVEAANGRTRYIERSRQSECHMKCGNRWLNLGPGLFFPDAINLENRPARSPTYMSPFLSKAIPVANTQIACKRNSLLEWIHFVNSAIQGDW